MERPRVIAAALAVVGVLLQLVGMSWDALMHAADPGLAAREGIFTLGNPSHALIAGGLAITVSAVAGLLGQMAISSGGSAAWRGVAVGGVAVLAVGFGSVTTLGLVTGAGFGGHSHGGKADHHDPTSDRLAKDRGGPSPGGQADHHDRKSDRPAKDRSGPSPGGEADHHDRKSDRLAKDHGGPSHGGKADHHDPESDRLAKDPTFLSLKEILRQQGTEKALQRLEELAASDRGVLGQSHQLAHALGRYSFSYYRDAPVAFGRCRETFESGCYHGVLEGYFGSLKEVTRSDVATLCDRAATKAVGSVLRFQCVHGLGHGLSGHFNGSIPKALSFCDALPTAWDQTSCHSGVFMENISVAFHLKYGDKSTHAHGDFKVALKDDDPQYPCSAVADKYKVACYGMQSAAMLMTNGYDFERAFAACDAAPAPYIQHCYSSMGRDIAGFTHRDPAKSVALCSRGNPSHRGHCFAGVAKNFIGVAWRVEPAATFCRQAPDDTKTLCYQAIGDQVVALPGDAAAKEQACATVEAGFVEVCRRAARLVS
jgi:hypothetical protein